MAVSTPAVRMLVCAYFVPSTEVAVICYCRPNTVLFMTSASRTFVTGEIAHILCLTAHLIWKGAGSQSCDVLPQNEHMDGLGHAGRHRDATFCSDK